jgi:hypothetical protein
VQASESQRGNAATVCNRVYWPDVPADNTEVLHFIEQTAYSMKARARGLSDVAFMEGDATAMAST